MPYATGNSYITHAEWAQLIGTAQLTQLGIADDATSLLFRETASALIDEAALSAGVPIPLATAHMTAAMKRRVAVIAVFNAADPKQQYRDKNGKNPFHDQRDTAVAELKQWVDGTRSTPGDDVDVVDGTCATSNPRRRWIR